VTEELDPFTCAGDGSVGDDAEHASVT